MNTSTPPPSVSGGDHPTQANQHPVEPLGIDEVNQLFVDLVTQASGIVGDVDPKLWVSSAQAEVLFGLLRFQTQLDALVTSLAGEVDASMEWSVHGSRSPAAFLERGSGRSRKECNELVRNARDLRDMPHTEEQYNKGLLSAAHVKVLGKAKNKIPHRFGDAEAMLVGYAGEHSFEGFKRLVDHWIKVADPDMAEADALQRYEKRSLHLNSGLDGVGWLDVQFEPLGHEIFRNVLKGIEQELWLADWNLAKAQHGPNTTAADLQRTNAQRSYDALIAMATRAHNNTHAPTCPKHQPVLAANPPEPDATETQNPLGELSEVEYRQWIDEVAEGYRKPSDHTPTPECDCHVANTQTRITPLITVHVDHQTLTGRVCELGSGVQITPGHITKLIDNIHVEIERAVFDTQSRIIDLGRRSRLYTGGAKRAIQIRDRHCQHPGCTIPAQYCQIDHKTPWNQGGQTNHQNGQLLCPTHHHNKHKWHPAA